jgi:hypothetical protein
VGCRLKSGNFILEVITMLNEFELESIRKSTVDCAKFGATAGGYYGSATGMASGILTGPGAIVTAAVGGTVGGAVAGAVFGAVGAVFSTTAVLLDKFSKQ